MSYIIISMTTCMVGHPKSSSSQMIFHYRNKIKWSRMKSRCVYFIHINEVYKIHGLVHCCINIESERGLGQMKAHVQSCASKWKKAHK